MILERLKSSCIYKRAGAARSQARKSPNARTFFLSTALISGVMWSCSQGDDASKLADTDNHTPQISVPIKLTLEASLDEQAAKAMSYSTDALGKPLLRTPSSDETIPVHCVIRSDNATDSPTFLTLNFVQNAGSKTLTYNGTGLTINAGDFTKTKGLSGRKWYLMGIIGGTPEVDPLGKMTGKIKFRGTDVSLPRVVAGSTANLDVPYTSGWTELELRHVDGQTELHGGGLSSLTFQPRGAIIRLRFANELPYSHAQVLQYATIASYMDSHVDFNLNVAPQSSSAPTWSYADTKPAAGWTRYYKLATQTVDMPAQTEDNAYYLLWTMPDGSANKGFASYPQVRDRVRMRALGEDEHTLTNPRLCPLGTYSLAQNAALTEGKTFRLKVRIGANWNPLNEVMDESVAGHYTNPTLVSSRVNSAPGIYNIYEATHIFNLIGARYNAYIPGLTGLKTLFGDAGAWEFMPAASFAKDYTETVHYRGSDRLHRSQYQSYAGHQLAYACRFQGSTQQNGQNYCAFRYSLDRYPENAGQPLAFSGTLTIKSLYLGPGAHQKISDTAVEAWWNGLSTVAQNAIVTKYFPASGSGTLVSGNLSRSPLNHFTMWSSTPTATWPIFNYFHIYLIPGSQNTPNYRSFDGGSFYAGVRMFIG